MYYIVCMHNIDVLRTLFNSVYYDLQKWSSILSSIRPYSRPSAHTHQQKQILTPHKYSYLPNKQRRHTQITDRSDPITHCHRTTLYYFCMYTMKLPPSTSTVQITFIFIDFRVCDFAFAFKTQNAPCISRFKRVFIFRLISICVLNANETFVWLVNAFDASYIAHNSSHGYAPLHRTLSLKLIWPAVSETLVLN